MGCINSKTLDEDGRVETAATGDYIAKQDVTIWSYSENGNLSSSTIPENSRVEVRSWTNEEKSVGGEKSIFLQLLDENPKWWKVKSGRREGFASKHYFVHKDARKEYERKPWYFGDMTREDAERLLGHTANNDGFVFLNDLS